VGLPDTRDIDRLRLVLMYCLKNPEECLKIRILLGDLEAAKIQTVTPPFYDESKIDTLKRLFEPKVKKDDGISFNMDGLFNVVSESRSR
jgi:hypothetical protein